MTSNPDQEVILTNYSREPVFRVTTTQLNLQKPNGLCD